MMIVTIVHTPNFPPNITPTITITISKTIRTTFTCQPFFSANENVTASYDPRPKEDRCHTYTDMKRYRNSLPQDCESCTTKPGI